MKRSDLLNIPAFVAFLVPLVLIAPNVELWILGENINFFVGVVSVIFPLGIYFLIMSLSRKTPVTSLCLIPLMVICAFQIVISALYNDDSPIGVDMFINAVTTNATEMGELLSGLIIPLIIIVILYLPVIVISIIGCCKHQMLSASIMMFLRKIGIWSSIFGLVGIIIWISVAGIRKFTDAFFPVNDIVNLVEAFDRYFKTRNYSVTSDNFTYNAQSSRPEQPEIYFAVIGETSRAENWEILGYDRPTNPRLKVIGSNLTVFPKTISESNTTHKSVPMLLSTISADTFNDSIYRHKSIITAFKEAGFNTVYISNQERNNSFLDNYADEADITIYLPRRKSVPYDFEVIPIVDSLLTEPASNKKQFIVLHLYGSHYRYYDRYPREKAVFTPDQTKITSTESRQRLINAYDNTIVATDELLSELINRLDSLDYNGGLIYTSDHGEDIFDDSRERFLHASPTPTYMQLHVPFLYYLNESYIENNPRLAENGRTAQTRLLSSSRSFGPSLLQMAGIETQYLDCKSSIFDEAYQEPQTLLFLNDKNEGIDLLNEAFGITDIHEFKERILENEK